MPPRINISSILAAGTALLATSAGAEPFELSAYEAPGMLPFPGEIIIPDARKLVPEAAAKCGIVRVGTVEATDGVVLFRLDASREQRRCLERTLPKGVQLRSLAPWQASADREES